MKEREPMNLSYHGRFICYIQIQQGRAVISPEVLGKGDNALPRIKRTLPCSTASGGLNAAAAQGSKLTNVLISPYAAAKQKSFWVACPSSPRCFLYGATADLKKPPGRVYKTD